MPGAFDRLGRFETSLRSYNNGARPLPECPNDVHSPEECECRPGHEFREPHCANDIPLGPASKLTHALPIGGMTSYTYHRCRSGGCDGTVLPGEVTHRLYTTPTRSSSAKLRTTGSRFSIMASTCTLENLDDIGSNGSSGGGSDDSSSVANTEKSLDLYTVSPAASTADCIDKDGGDERPSGRSPRLVSELITAHPPGNHNQSRRDGESPPESRRSLSARGGRHHSGGGGGSKPSSGGGSGVGGNPCKRSLSSCAAPDVKNRVPLVARRVNSGGGNNDSSSGGNNNPRSRHDDRPDEELSGSVGVDGSPSSCNSNGKQKLSPRNSSSGNSANGSTSTAARHSPKSVGCTPRATVSRPSAAFAGFGREKRRTTSPLTRSPSDVRTKSPLARTSTETRHASPLSRTSTDARQQSPLTRVHSDGPQRVRGSFRRGKCNGSIKQRKVGEGRASNVESIRPGRSRLSTAPNEAPVSMGVASLYKPSKDDELLRNARLVLSTLAPECDVDARYQPGSDGVRIKKKGKNDDAGRDIDEDSLEDEPGLINSGKNIEEHCKDLAVEIQRCMERMNTDLVSISAN